MESKFSLAFEHRGEVVAVSIETNIETETLRGGDDAYVRLIETNGGAAGVIDRLAAAAKGALLP